MLTHEYTKARLVGEYNVLEQFKVDREFLKKSFFNNYYNRTIFNYYGRLFAEHEAVRKDKEDKARAKQSKYGRAHFPHIEHATDVAKRIYNKAHAVIDCNSWWSIDVYENAKIKDMKRTNLCKDKFCANCKKVKQAVRTVRFIDYLQGYDDNLYHVVLTNPNCPGEELSETITRMFKSFQTLVRYLSGRAKIKGLDFNRYGYLGALRSLEITFRGDDYHPHIHAAFAFENDLVVTDKHLVNKFSYSNKKKGIQRYFSEFEVMLQKIWYLLINGFPVTASSINKSESYSCTVDRFSKGDYAEVFKYMIKETDEANKVLTYENFKVLEKVLFGRRQIQGYGTLYNLKDDDRIPDDIFEELKDKYDQEYADILRIATNYEVPDESSEQVKQMFYDLDYDYISKKSLFKKSMKLIEDAEAIKMDLEAQDKVLSKAKSLFGDLVVDEEATEKQLKKKKRKDNFIMNKLK